MGWGFRKSTTVGGVRFTFSKSGVSTSIGRKGFRITSGPRGVYVTTGFGGFYYRQRLGGGPPRRSVAPRPEVQNRDPQFYATEMYSSADVGHLSDVTQDEFVASLNHWTRRGALQLITILGIVCAFLFANAHDAVERTYWQIGAYGVIAFLLARFIENRRRRFLLIYDLGEQEMARYRRTGQAFEELAKSGSFKAVKMVGHHHDWKRNAGATRSLTFESASLRHAVPSHIVTNLVPWMLQIQGMQLYFFPDRVLIRSRGRFAALSYSALGVSTYTASFVWDSFLPRDAQVIGQTWRFVRKDGGPDRRFNGNRQIPLVHVAYLELASATGLNAAVQTTRVSAAEWVERELQRYAREVQAASTSAREDIAPEIRAALTTLGLVEIPSLQILKTVYRDLAQRNHPDKFSGARHDIRMFAEQRMQEINRGYALLAQHMITASDSTDPGEGAAGQGVKTGSIAPPPIWRSPEAWAVLSAVIASALVSGAFRNMPAHAEPIVDASRVEAPAPPEVEPPPAAQPVRKRVLIACPLRVAPSSKSRRLAVIRRNTELELLDSQSGWWQVRAGDGLEGWAGPKCWEPTSAKPTAKRRRPRSSEEADENANAAVEKEAMPVDPYAETSDSGGSRATDDPDSGLAEPAPADKGELVDPFESSDRHGSTESD